MEETGVAVKLEAHEHEIGSLNHRIEELERQSKSVQENVISISRMTINIESMLKELNRQEERLEVLERVPVETGKLIKSAIITTLVGGTVGAVVTGMLTLL
ncbi:MAG: hypothetical protein K2O16_12920 [Lachnospiraceae bacterium]|nr:hypothetical protein [Lachnospiraceae bacterium]MDE7333109.1 hypothetical protein [Lachnospiraceae bacterium]